MTDTTPAGRELLPERGAQAPGADELLRAVQTASAVVMNDGEAQYATAHRYSRDSRSPDPLRITHPPMRSRSLQRPQRPPTPGHLLNSSPFPAHRTPSSPKSVPFPHASPPPTRPSA